MNKPITSRTDLFEYLKRNDRATLDFLMRVAKEFGRPETIAYVRKKGGGTDDV